MIKENIAPKLLYSSVFYESTLQIVVVAQISIFLLSELTKPHLQAGLGLRMLGKKFYPA